MIAAILGLTTAALGLGSTVLGGFLGEKQAKRAEETQEHEEKLMALQAQAANPLVVEAPQPPISVIRRRRPDYSILTAAALVAAGVLLLREKS